MLKQINQLKIGMVCLMFTFGTTGIILCGLGWPVEGSVWSGGGMCEGSIYNENIGSVKII